MPAKTTKDEESVRIARTSKTGATGLRPANDTTLRFAPRGSISRFVSCVDRDGGKTQKIWRSPTCQVAVFSQYTRRQVRFVRGGTLDEPAAVAPDVHIYTRLKLPWVTLPEYVPAFAGATGLELPTSGVTGRVARHYDGGRGGIRSPARTVMGSRLSGGASGHAHELS